ncbi:MAG: hypothetical protein WCE45_08780 [Sedimentisphaerales bacterium]
MTSKSVESELWHKRVNRWKKISTISPKDIFEICQNYLAESADATLGRQRKEYPPSMKIPPEKESQFFPLVWAAEIRGMSTEASQIEHAITPMMTHVGSGKMEKESNLYKIITEGECAVESLCRKIQLEICEKEEPKNEEKLTTPQRIKLWLITFVKETYRITVKSFFDSISGK